ncbi:bacteriocin-like protein [Chryseobacterium ginsengisoli]|uniref:bacteriocin-like protein n=1 Tax=Chryseobacterium ginsengisoli TaxID=363853 RepID=UPI003CD0832E
MKNLKKLSRQELKSVNGGAINCGDFQTIPGVPRPECPCKPGYQKCKGACIPNDQLCS